jgi:hypothetical protein
VFEVKDKKLNKGIFPKTSGRRWDLRGIITVRFGFRSSMRRKIQDFLELKIFWTFRRNVLPPA